MVNQTVSSVEAAMGPWDATAYPNIRVVAPSDADLLATPRQTLGMLLFTIHAIRGFERWLLDHADLVHGPLHSSIGQEAVAAGMAFALAGSDGLTSTHRAHHDVLAKLIRYAAPADFDPFAADAVPGAITDLVLATLAEVLGLEQGLCGGRGGSMHLAHPGAGVVTSAIVGGGIPPAVGAALAAKLKGDGGVGVAAFGDGATAIGAFHEGLAIAPCHGPAGRSSCWRTTATRWPHRCWRPRASSSWPSAPRATTCPRSSWTAWTRSRCC